LDQREEIPGAVGVDIVKQIDRAVRELDGGDRLTIDLRGNAGGGLAFLRVMSYLAPDRLAAGSSANGKMIPRRKRGKETTPLRPKARKLTACSFVFSELIGSKLLVEGKKEGCEC
jgi:hypothetical protein